MRIVGLLLLAILILPISAHAVDSTWLKTYTISNEVICPSAPDVCPATSTTIDIEFYEVAKNVSIDFVSSDETKTRFYHSDSVTNPQPKTWDGTYLDGSSKGAIMPSGVYSVVVSATISGSELIDSSRTITVSSTVGANNNDASTTDSSTQEQTVSGSSGGTTTYKPPPSALTLDAGTNQDAVMEVPLHLFARAVVKGGAVDPNAQIVWGFGDGSSAEGSAVEKTYRYAGTYLVVVTATDGQATGRDEFIVTVRPAQVRILEIPDTGIVIINDTNERLDLSSWALFADKSSFRVPNGTVLLPKANVLFSSTITKLPTAPEVTLAYPNGGIAARYAAPVSPVETVVQLSGPVTGFNEVQTVEPIISAKQDIQVHENTAVSAPAPVSNKETGAGAVSTVAENKTAAVGNSGVGGIFKSPWALSFLGVVVLAGSAFIFL